jgi:predicted SnoaL-like aldol condensation-catalyzing enzyme
MTLDQQCTHKEAAIEFLKLASSGHARQAYEQFVAPAFKHHNPHVAAGARPLMEAMAANAREYPDKALEIEHVVAESDLVAVHAHVRPRPSDPGMALVHIFRFDETNRIVELWDLGQPVPVESPNQHGMF